MKNRINIPAEKPDNSKAKAFAARIKKGCEDSVAACVTCAAMVDAEGEAEAFLNIQATMPHITREQLRRMVAIGRKPNEAAFGEVVGLMCEIAMPPKS